MTDFEKKINRTVKKEKFEEIRDHVYGDGKNTFSYTYGDVASWFTWNRKTNGQIANVPPPIPELTKKGHYYDGPIGTWDGDKLPVGLSFSPRITTDIVFLGLNMSINGTPGNLPPFQNARGHRKIVKTFFGTEAEGGGSGPSRSFKCTLFTILFLIRFLHTVLVNHPCLVISYCLLLPATLTFYQMDLYDFLSKEDREM
jgi:hypothetical protein